MRLSLGLVALLAACQRTPEPAREQPGSGSAVAEPPDDQAEKMRHCPVTMPGIATEISDIDGGVKLVLRAKTGAADVVPEVRARAHRLEGRPRRSGGRGGGGGTMRNCPVVVKDTQVVAADIENGVEITVTPDDASQLATLRAETRARFERAPIERAAVVREERSDEGDTRLFAGRAEDLDGDGTIELVTGGFTTVAGGERRPTIRVYRQEGIQWDPIAEAGWDGGAGSLVRNIDIADVDGDGRPEVIALGRVGSDATVAKARVAVFALVGGKLEKRAEVDWSGGEYTHGYGLAAADFDGDQRAELVTTGFQFDGAAESGFVRVWSLKDQALTLRAEARLDGEGQTSMRINDVAIADVDGDQQLEIVTAGRRAMAKEHGANKDRSARRESGDISILELSDNALEVRARYAWKKGNAIRLRSLVVGDLDGDGRAEIVAGGQYDADGKTALGLFVLEKTGLVLKDDASATVEGVAGEIKDLALVQVGTAVRVLATGVIGDKPGRHGDVVAWHVADGKLVHETGIVSRNGDETRTRAIVIVPRPTGQTVLTIGHAATGTAMVGQVLQWQLGTP